jgi:hypothetical protein
MSEDKTAPANEGYGETTDDDPSRSSEEQARRDGVMPAEEERARIMKGDEDSAGLPEELPALLGDRVENVEEPD